MFLTGRINLLLLAATSPLVAIACGANVPTKSEAIAALSKAIDATLTRTLPSLTYCMTANPDFSFANMGQLDFVEMFQNLKDKSALSDATTAGVVRVELREFRFNPAGRSPDPSCDAVHAQSRKSGHTSAQVRLAMVRTMLTPKAAASGVQLDRPIDVATRELVDSSRRPHRARQRRDCEVHLAMEADEDGRRYRLHTLRPAGGDCAPPPI
jgi:hypothetical protein